MPTETNAEWAKRIHRENPTPQFPNHLEDAYSGWDAWEKDEDEDESPTL